ncbi:WbqC family protein [Bradyrhizobium sp.]|uniref:WbqC family protein n=1 Tax=Bradyrhizobium sp. TaxID=376 RepID=UPI0026138471|nr:WbqC family protein [Bradyrhizobium sp.]
MSRTAVIHQPDFLPYLGFFERLLHADVFVLLDSVQYVNSSRGWTHRDKIKTPNGAKWISISVNSVPRDTPICEIELSDHVDWRTNHLNLLRENYRKSPHFAEIFPEIEQLYACRCTKLSDFNRASIELLMRLFDIRIETVTATSLFPDGKSNELLVNILKKIGADRYLSGSGAKAYFRPEPFAAAGVEVLWQDFQHPVYTQLHGDFVPYLSSIDLLLNCGADQSRKILRNK